MGMRVICRYCKSKIEKKDALQIPGGKYNTYYCNQECYSKANAEKKAKEIERLAKKQENEEYVKEKAEYDEIYELCCKIFGYRIGSYPLLKKQIQPLEQTANRKKIIAYLENETDTLSKIMHKDFNNEYNRIKYFMAVISSSVYDYKPKPKIQVVEKKVDNTFYDLSDVSNKSKRRALDDLEDEIW